MSFSVWTTDVEFEVAFAILQFCIYWGLKDVHDCPGRLKTSDRGWTVTNMVYTPTKFKKNLLCGSFQGNDLKETWRHAYLPSFSAVNVGRGGEHCRGVRGACSPGTKLSMYSSAIQSRFNKPVGGYVHAAVDVWWWGAEARHMITPVGKW